MLMELSIYHNQHLWPFTLSHFSKASTIIGFSFVVEVITVHTQVQNLYRVCFILGINKKKFISQFRFRSQRGLNSLT